MLFWLGRKIKKSTHVLIANVDFIAPTSIFQYIPRGKKRRETFNWYKREHPASEWTRVRI